MDWNLQRRSRDPLWDFGGHDLENPDLGDKEEVGIAAQHCLGRALDFEMLGNLHWEPLKLHIPASGDARIG